MATDPFEELLLRAYPNPERKGCPGSQALQDAAEEPVSFDHPTLQHIRQCSPCFAEFRVFRDARRSRDRLQRLAWLSGIAALLMVGVAAIAFSLYRNSHSMRGRTDSASVRDTASRPVAQLVALDFRSLSPVRGAAPESTDPAHSWVIPAAIVTLRMTLPFASDDGSYRLEFVRNDDVTVKKFSGSAQINEGDTVLTAYDVDLSRISPGKYKLLFAHADASWHAAEVMIR